MNFKKQLALGLVAVATLFSTTPAADAAFQVTLRVGAASTTISDNDAVLDTDLAVNTIQVTNVVVGGFTFSGTFATTNTPGGPSLSFVNSGVNRVAGAVGTPPETFEIVASATGFTNPVSPPELNAISAATFQFRSNSTPGVTATFTQAGYLDQANTLATDDLVVDGDTFLISSGTTAALAAPVGNQTLNDLKTVTNTVTPYSITYVLGGTLHNSGNYRFDVDGTIELTPIPAPAGLVLLATAAPALALGWARRRKAQLKNS